MDTDQLVQAAIGYHGAQQDPDELAMVLRLLNGDWPVPLILEIGCDQGGTLWLWQHLARRVVAVTLHTRADGSFKTHGATVIEGDSAEPGVKQQAEAAMRGTRPAIVLVDGCHCWMHATADMRWALSIAGGGAVIVHDIQPRLDQPQIETHRAWAHYRTRYPRAEVVARPAKSPGTGVLFPPGPSGAEDRRQ